MDTRPSSPVETSHWPLPGAGQRVIIPPQLLTELAQNPLCRDCLAHGVGFYPKAAGHHMARTHPRDHLLIYCLAGSGRAELEGREQAVNAGDVLLLPAGRRHTYRASHSSPWSIYWIHLGGLLVEDYFHAIAGNHHSFVASVGCQPRLTNELDLLLATVPRFRSHHQIYAANLIKSLLSFMALARDQRQERNTTLDVARVRAWLQEHLHERIELDRLVSATSRLSRYHFIRSFKQATGQTPMQAFAHLKISRACYLLDITDRSIGDIAADLGYDDPYYFSRQFKKMMGLSPRAYRRENSPG